MLKLITQKLKKIIDKFHIFEDLFFYYKYEIFSLIIMSSLILLYCASIFENGHIVFSDLDFPLKSDNYIKQIFGLWNEKFSSANGFNIPRLLFIYIPYEISKLFDNSGTIFIKSVILILIFCSAFFMYGFLKIIMNIYFEKKMDLFNILIIIIGALFYALNPWVIFRIQHIFLLCGYAFFPLVVKKFLDIFHPKFMDYHLRKAELSENESKKYYIFSKIVMKKTKKDIIILSIIYAISSAAIHYFFFNSIYLGILWFFILVKYFFSFLIRYGKEKAYIFLINHLKKSFYLGVFIGLFNFYWLSIYVGNILLKIEVSQHNINLIDSINMFNRNSYFNRVIYLISYWWPMFDLENLPRSFYLGGAIILLTIIIAVLFKVYNNNFVIWLGISSILFILFSTGVRYPIIAEIFLIITNLPIIGNIFRDSNKLIGILAFNYAVLLAFGMETVITYFHSKFYEKLFKTVFMIILIIGFTLYIKPLKKSFFDGFYAPIKVSKAYDDMNSYLENKVDKKIGQRVLYLPKSEDMIQPEYGVATPFWNINPNSEGRLKATADFHVYNSSYPTIFHHEGNIPSLTHYLNYLQDNLDYGKTLKFNELLKPLVSHKLIYHDEYMGQEDRQKFNKEILGLQDELKIEYKNHIFNLYGLNKPLNYIEYLPKKILSPYGFSHLNSLIMMKGFDFNSYAILYSSLSHSNYLDNLKDDYIELYDQNDYFLSSLDKKYYVEPFDFINEGNVYIRWTKTFLKNPDWKWFLRLQNIENNQYDHSLAKGVAVTFASARLNLPAHKFSMGEGKLIGDFNSFLQLDRFFVPDNPKTFEITATPINKSIYFPTIHGKISRAYPKNIWQVAKSGIMPAKGNLYYLFKLKVSGKDSTKLHFKVRFFNKNLEELDHAYVVSPREQIDYNRMDFLGELVSPKGAKFMRMELLTFANPQKKVFWWLHDIKILEFSKYTGPNILNVEKMINKEGNYKIFIRSYDNISGGLMNIKIGEEEKRLNSKTSRINRFVWHDLGDYDLEPGKLKILVNNIYGFNAIDSFIIIPNKIFKLEKSKMLKIVNKNNIFFNLEAEKDFNYKGNIQSDRRYPELSAGFGTSIDKGELYKEIDIVNANDYFINLRLNLPLEKKSKISFKIIDENGKVLLNENLDNLEKKWLKDKTDYFIETDYGKNFYRKLEKSKNLMKNLVEVNFPKLFLKRGRYKILIMVDSKIKSISNLNNFRGSVKNDIRVNYLPPDELTIDEGYRIKIDESMHKKIYKKGVLTINIKNTFSRAWYEYGDIVPVKEDHEYLLSLKMRSINAKYRHMKIEYLNENRLIMETKFLNEVEEANKNRWNSYEQIFKIPKGIKYVAIKILSRGDFYNDGKIIIKDYSFKDYSSFPMIDRLSFTEKKDYYNFFKRINDEKNIVTNRIDSMKREFDLGNNRGLFNYGEIFHNFWLLNKNVKPILINGVTNGYYIMKNGVNSLEIIHRQIYYIGLVIFVLSFAFSLYWIRR